MYQIKLNEILAGYSLSTSQGGELVSVQYRGFVLQSEGREFIRKAEGVVNRILSKLPVSISPNDVKTLVVIINKNLEADVYINECDVIAEAVISKSVNKGDPVTKNDLYHIHSVNLSDIKFPSDCSYIILLTNGWDRVFYYDFGPTIGSDEKKLIDYDVNRFLGLGLSASLFFEMFDLSSKEWEKIINTGWFPFSYLTYEQQENLINHIKYDWDMSSIIDGINDTFIGGKDEWLEALNANEAIRKHLNLVSKALTHHMNGDYESAIHLLYPRLEALLREDFISKNPGMQGRKQQILANHIGTNISGYSHHLSRYFPEKFSEFILKSYFKDFDPDVESDFVSRNSLSHGSVGDSALTLSSSIVGFLILDQIHRYTHFSNNVKIERR
ncbi:hypothetical protein QX213_03925 [Vibrio vulnificus]|uniref:hypothetical protein n=1 Tax=Vibrio vulnificus TaxID=672 RepID=UPI001A208FF8|nr:hypothetical protein [Vibrio vulnificus]EHU0328794.1 hypothetical protein [Vibrio vulnificus]MDS1843043.1 hypothetical protein [Vibrio vulnificus]HAT8549223.1 hypothetical protein [Vibrio vulnificus]